MFPTFVIVFPLCWLCYLLFCMSLIRFKGDPASLRDAAAAVEVVRQLDFTVPNVLFDRSRCSGGPPIPTLIPRIRRTSPLNRCPCRWSMTSPARLRAAYCARRCPR